MDDSGRREPHVHRAFQHCVGVAQGGIGVFATIAGVLAGGAVIARIGVNRSLWVFGSLQAASNLAYLSLYALLSSLLAVGRDVVAAPSGAIAEVTALINTEPY
jgi:PAT family beta-lactamase induction signal transducer AmpG